MCSAFIILHYIYYIKIIEKICRLAVIAEMSVTAIMLLTAEISVTAIRSVTSTMSVTAVRTVTVILSIRDKCMREYAWVCVYDNFIKILKF